MIVGLLLIVLAGLIWHALLLHMDRWSLLDRQRRARSTEMTRLVASYAEDLARNKMSLLKRYCTVVWLGGILLFLEC